MLFRHKIIVLIALGVALALVFQGLVPQTAMQNNALKELAQELNTLCGSIKEWQQQIKTNPAVDEQLAKSLTEAHTKYDEALLKVRGAGLIFPVNTCLVDVAKNIVNKTPVSAGKTVILP